MRLEALLMFMFGRREIGPTTPWWRWLAVGLTVVSSGCFGPSADEAVMALTAENVAAYWSVRDKRGENNYIRPVVRFQIRNGGEREVDYIQTMAVFRLERSPEESWGNAFQYSISGDPIAPGELSRIITLRSDATFFSKDEPRNMLDNEEWEQVTVDLFFRVGASAWNLTTKVEVPKRLGAPGVDRFLEPPEPESSPGTPPPSSG